MDRATVLVLALIGSFFIAGVAEPFVARPGEPFSVAAPVHMIVIGILCFAWCKAHAMTRGIEPPSGSALLAGLLPLVGVPAYFFRSMPWRTATIASLKSIGVVVVMLGLFFIGYLLADTVRT